VCLPGARSSSVIRVSCVRCCDREHCFHGFFCGFLCGFFRGFFPGFPASGESLCPLV
jgi:hypothetical protein